MLELSDERATSRIGERGFLGDPRRRARQNSSGASFLGRRAWLWTGGWILLGEVTFPVGSTMGIRNLARRWRSARTNILPSGLCVGGILRNGGDISGIFLLKNKRRKVHGEVTKKHNQRRKNRIRATSLIRASTAGLQGSSGPSCPPKSFMNILSRTLSERQYRHSETCEWF